MKRRYPAEWEKQKSIWLSFPHNQESWNSTALIGSMSGLEVIQEFYLQLMDLILDYQDINLIFNNHDLFFQFESELKSYSNKAFQIHSHIIPNNDIWIRDYGPFFMEAAPILDFGFNAWGEKFSPWDDDNSIPYNISQALNSPLETNSMILEGGSLDFSGDGLVLTTEQCLLNKNRNPHMSKLDIEKVLKDSFGLNQVLWLKRGLEGDHTDGHIDDFARFIDHRKILLASTSDQSDPNYSHLEESYKYLSKWNNAELEIIRIPLPEPSYGHDGLRLPSSYTNFIYLNDAIIAPIFDTAQDYEALEILSNCFPQYTIIGIDSSFLIQQGGALHCMSKQESITKA